MTAGTIVSHVQNRLNLTTSDSTTRLLQYVNERYRRVVTSLGLGLIRRSQALTFNTVAGTEAYTPSTFIKIYTITYPAMNRVLRELTLDEIRVLDPAGIRSGPPEAFAVIHYGANTVVIHLYPSPDEIYTLSVDGLVTGVDMVSGDIPAIPEDFHDLLIFGVLADELDKMEKPKTSTKYEALFEMRMKELRYFIAKSAYKKLLPASERGQINWSMREWGW